jgi:hypothetical protein
MDFRRRADTPGVLHFSAASQLGMQLTFFI